MPRPDPLPTNDKLSAPPDQRSEAPRPGGRAPELVPIVENGTTTEATPEPPAPQTFGTPWPPPRPEKPERRATGKTFVDPRGPVPGAVVYE